jgi:SAM-dependent methyltransferase
VVAIVSRKREAIHRAVRDMYTAVASAPGRRFHFPTGRAACELLGYPADHVAALPQHAVESFAGVGYPFAAGVIGEGHHVLDVGSGSGTDALICARIVGPRGRVYGLDMTPAMRAKLQATAAAAGIANIEVLGGDAEAIPLADAAVDVVTTNGVLNLVPDKARALAEIHRVLKPGGRLQIADIALARPVAERFRQDPELWAECVVGAVEEGRYMAMLRAAGFEEVERLADLDYFALSASEKTREVARLFNAHSVALRARKPLAPRAQAFAPARRAALNLAREIGGVAVAVVAWLTCAGLPALVALFGAVGAGGLAGHAYTFPAFVAFLGLSVWLLWRSARLRDDPRPFRLALAGAAYAVVATWLALTEVAPPAVGMSSYLGTAAVVAASIWSFRLARRPGDCLAEMMQVERARARRGSVARRAALAALGVAVVFAGFYGLHWATATFAPH